MLFSTDFDGTIAQTFVPSPRNIGVQEAYRRSCSDIFGLEGQRLHDQIGGIKNRAPIELVNELLETGNRRQLIRRAESFLSREIRALEGFVPEGKGASLDWVTNSPSLVIAEILVRVKMRHFWAEIGRPFADGRIWPEPCVGFLEFYQGFLEFAKCYPSAKVELAILSSGHDLFITKCFEAWGIPQPDLLVTDDIMRSSACMHISPERRMKPASGPFEILERDWCAKFDEELDHSRTLYIGDSVKSDGGLAVNLEIPFVWFNPGKQTQSSFAGDLIEISDWRELLPVLQLETLEKLEDGVSLADIMKEVFATK